MSNYIIPDGWNPMTEPWEEGRIVNVISKDGILSSTTKDETHLRGTFFVAWQYPVPLEKKRRFGVWPSATQNQLPDAYKWNVVDIATNDVDCICARFKSKEHAEAFAKYLEENEP